MTHDGGFGGEKENEKGGRSWREWDSIIVYLQLWRWQVMIWWLPKLINLRVENFILKLHMDFVDKEIMVRNLSKKVSVEN